MAKWTDAESMVLLAVRADEQINRLFTGTVRDRQLIDIVVNTLAERGVKQDKNKSRPS